MDDTPVITLSALLAFIRISAFFVASPFPGRLAPPTIRLIISAGLAWGLSAGLPIAAPVSIWGAVLSEAALGLAIGYLLGLVTYTFAFAGEAISQQMGLRIPGFVSPIGQNLSLLGSAMSMLMIGFFALGDGPRMLVLFHQRMFEIVPPGSWSMPRNLDIPIVAGLEIFSGALQVGGPMISAVFSAQLVLAILARSVPTLNLFIEGPALTTSTGIIGLIATVGTYGPLTIRMVTRRLEQIAIWLSG